MTTGPDPLTIGQKIGQITPAGPDYINTATAVRVDGDDIELTVIVNGLQTVTYVLPPHVAASVIQALARAMR